MNKTEYRITYQPGLNSNTALACQASAYEVKSGKFVTCAYAATWMDARSRVIELVKEANLRLSPPKDEVVEI